MAAEDLCTLANVREFLQKQTPDTQQDAVISSLITRASNAILRYTEREFAPTATSTAREFEWDGYPWLSLAPYDLRTATTVQLNSDEASPTTIPSSDYRLFPYPARNGVYTALRLEAGTIGSTTFRNSRVKVTGDWGFASVPSDVAHWCIVTVAIWLRRDVAAFSTTFNLDEDRLERPEALPAAVRAGLGHYKRVTYA